jgi:hypothetical protein
MSSTGTSMVNRSAFRAPASTMVTGRYRTVRAALNSVSITWGSRAAD